LSTFEYICQFLHNIKMPKGAITARDCGIFKWWRNWKWTLSI